jgi:hypothetical protein
LRRQITPHVREIYARASELDAIHLACIRGEGCRSTQVNRHCSACATYYDLVREIHGALHLRLWQMLPYGCATVEDALVEMADDERAAGRGNWI